MSKRRNNCSHSNWHVFPGNIITCVDCGEQINLEDVLDWEESTDDSAVTFISQAPLTPTTFNMKLPS